MKCSRCLYEKMCYATHTPESPACADFRQEREFPEAFPKDEVYIVRKVRGKARVLPFTVKCVYMDEYSDGFKYDVYGRGDELLEALTGREFFTDKSAAELSAKQTK